MVTHRLLEYFDGREDPLADLPLEHEVVKTYEHGGIELGGVVKTTSRTLNFNNRYEAFVSEEFVPLVSDLDASVLAEELSPSERVHMKTKAPGLYGFLEQLGVDPKLYVSDEDIVLHVADSGYRNLTELNRGDKKTWELVKERGLVSKLFPELQPSE